MDSIKNSSQIFENLYYVIPPRKLFLSVKAYYQSIAFDFKNCPLKGKTILDFGCGNGLFSLYSILVANAQKVTSIDEFQGHGSPKIAYHIFAHIIKKYHLQQKITLIKANGLTYDFGTQKFDVIYCSYVLHHLFPKNQISITEELARILAYFKKLKNLLSFKGVLIIREAMRHNFLEWLPRRFTPFHVNWVSKRDASEWSTFLYQAGFKLVKTRYYIPYYLDLHPFRALASNRLAAFFSTSRYVLECR
ncbi:MAG: class I SAM-dependent methyltransferase [Candidatus Helarchaeota archaeon]